MKKCIHDDYLTPLAKTSNPLSLKKKRQQFEGMKNYKWFKSHIIRLFKEQRGRCYYCLSHFTYKQPDPEDSYFDCWWAPFDLYKHFLITVDHRVPLARDGTNQPENLVLSCNDCNMKKGMKDYSDVSPAAIFY